MNQGDLAVSVALFRTARQGRGSFSFMAYLHAAFVIVDTSKSTVMKMETGDYLMHGCTVARQIIHVPDGHTSLTVKFSKSSYCIDEPQVRCLMVPARPGGCDR